MSIFIVELIRPVAYGMVLANPQRQRLEVEAVNRFAAIKQLDIKNPDWKFESITKATP